MASFTLYRGVGLSVAQGDETGALGRADRFRELCAEVEPRLRRTLVAAYGADLGSDAAADALAWAWEHFERVEAMANPAGYLWRVGQTSVRRSTRWRRSPWTAPTSSGGGERGGEGGGEYAFEPALGVALAGLPERQRTAVLLVHGYGYTLTEAAEVLGCRVRTLRNHVDRGLSKIRTTLGVSDDA